MPARRAAAAPPALSDEDVTSLRARLAAGENPRVVVRAASAAVAAGTRGNVVRLGDPKDGEYIVVRLGKDEVPFAPSELGISGRPAAPAAANPLRAPRKAAEPPRPRRAAVSRKPAKRVPPLSVTLRFSGGGWSIEAQRGARRLARPSSLRPGAVRALAEHVEDEVLRGALVETVDSSRAVVEAERAALRERLQAAEAALRDYDVRPTRKRS